MASITLKKLFRAGILPMILYLCPELHPLFAVPFTNSPFSASSAGRSLLCTSPRSHFDRTGVATVFTGIQQLCNSFPVKDMNPMFFSLSQDCYIYAVWILSTAPLFMWSVPWPGSIPMRGACLHPLVGSSQLTRGFPTGLLGSEYNTHTFYLCLHIHLSGFPEPEKTLRCLM